MKITKSVFLGFILLVSSNIILVSSSKNNWEQNLDAGKKLYHKQFCFETTNYYSILAWNFTKINGRRKSAIFYKDNRTLVIDEEGKKKKVYKEAFLFDGVKKTEMPFYNFDFNAVVSITKGNGYQKLSLAYLTENRLNKKIFTLPRTYNGSRLQYLYEDPLFLDDSTIILSVYYPDYIFDVSPHEYFKRGRDIIFRISANKGGEINILGVIGYYPKSYQKYEFVVQDYFPQRTLVGDTIFYSFKNCNSIFGYNISDVCNVTAFKTNPSNIEDVEPIEYSKADIESNVIDKKLVSEPGFLSLNYVKDKRLFLRIYKPRTNTSGRFIPLYFSAFKVFVYNSDFTLLKEVDFDAYSYRAYIMGDTKFQYMESLSDKVNRGCQFYELVL